MKILVAEDNPIFANTIEIIIEELGYELLGIADNTTEFMRLYAQERPDLLLLDIQLADNKTGIDIATEITENEDIPIIFMTSFKDNTLFEQVKKLQPLAYLIKPFDALLLQHIIELAFHKNRTAWLEKEVQARTKEIQTQAEELNKLNRMKDKIFAIIGHDLRAPINSLYSLLKMLDRQDISPTEFVEISDRLRTAVSGLHFTLHNILQWASYQMNTIAIQKVFINLHKLTEQIEILFKEIAEDKKVVVENRILPTLHVWADINQIEVVLRNLLNNALKYTPQGGKISIDAIEKNNLVEISIADTGIGINENTRQKLFQNIPIGSERGTDNEKGTGIGLMLCKEFIEQNGGTIAVESTVGKGSRFYFTLPANEQ
jgi:signal transduction histidine kinase